MTTPAGLLPSVHPCRDAPPGPVRFRQNHVDTAARLAPHWPSEEMPLGAMGLLGVSPNVIRTVVQDAQAAEDMVRLRTQVQAVLFKRRAQLPDNGVGSQARAAARRGPGALAGVLAKPMKQAARKKAWAAVLHYVEVLGGSLGELAERLENDAPSAGQGALVEEALCVVPN